MIHYHHFVFIEGVRKDEIKDDIMELIFKDDYQEGTPDLLILNKNKEYDGIAIYLYSPFMNSIKLSASTHKFIVKLKEINHKIIISNNVNEVIELLEEYDDN